MGKWEMVRLGDVCKVVSGSTPSTQNPELWDGDIKWVTPAEISDNSYFLYDTERHISRKAGLKPMPSGTVLLSSRAPIGKVAIAGEPMCCNQGFKNLICSGRIHNRFLYRYLKNQTIYLNSLGRGATFKEISKGIVENVLIPLPPLSVQEKIADILDRTSTLIEKRKSQVEKLDILVKSRFVEMFGYIKSNPYGFPLMPLGEVCKKITDGKHGGCNIENSSGYFFVGAREIYNGKIHYETAQEITSTDFIESYRRCNIEIGDFVIVNTGATIGKTAIAADPRTNHTLLQKSVALIKTKKDMLLPRFLQYCYISNPEMYKVESASAQPNLLLSKIRETEIFIPPLDLQTRFADFVQVVDKSKAELQRGLDKLELLYKSLIQKCFNGEVF